MCCGRSNYIVSLEHVATRIFKKKPYAIDKKKQRIHSLLNVHNAQILFEKLIRFKKIIYVSIMKIYAMSPSGHHKISYIGLYIEIIINRFLLALS